MLSSTDDAISVREKSSWVGGVGIWPSAPAGVAVSPGVVAWLAAQGGVEISPGAQGGVEISPAKAVPARVRLKAVQVTSCLRFFMVSPKVSSIKEIGKQGPVVKPS